MHRPIVLTLGPLLRLFSLTGALCLSGWSASLQAQTQPVVPKATIAPDSTARQVQVSPEAVMATLMMEPGARKVAPPPGPAKVLPESDTPHNWRMVIAALMLMGAIALRRRRSRS
jgi:MYXO-CTERM domain-containing protein